MAVDRAEGRKRSSLLVTSRLEPHTENALLAFFGWTGLMELYWREVRPLFADDGPGIVVLAQGPPRPDQQLQYDSVLAVAYARPVDGETAAVSPVVVPARLGGDVGLQLAVFQAVLRGLERVKMERIRIELGGSAPATARRLVDAGFSPGKASDDRSRFEAPIGDVLRRLKLDGVETDDLLDPSFGETPEHDAAIDMMLKLQVGGFGRMAGFVPGLVADPDGGTPEPGVPPEPPPPGPDAVAFPFQPPDWWVGQRFRPGRLFTPDGGTPEPGVPPTGPDAGFGFSTR